MLFFSIVYLNFHKVCLVSFRSFFFFLSHFTHPPLLVLHSVDTVLVDPATDSGPVYLIVWKVVIKTDVAVLVLQLMGNVRIERNEDKEPTGATTPAGAAVLM